MADTNRSRDDAAASFRPRLDPTAGEGGILTLPDGRRLSLVRLLAEDADRVRELLARLGAAETAAVARSLGVDEAGLDRFLAAPNAPRHGAFAVADGEGHLVAFGGFRPLADTPETGVTLAVAEPLRRQGVGSLLLEHLAVLAARTGSASLFGVAASDNRALRALFGSGGFRAEEQERGATVRFRLSTRDPGRTDGTGDLERRVYAAASLQPLFAPRAVAVIGASRQPGTVGYRVVESLLHAGFAGPIYPVNPRAHHVASIRAWPSVEAIDDDVDLAVIAIPAEHVIAAVESCAEAGVRGLVVVTAGFAETGDAGRATQRALTDAVRARGLRMVGPNCLGLLNTDPEVRLNASFAPRMPPAGGVALCSQSGALGVAIIAQARRLDLGLSAFVSVGNKADVSGNDLLEYWEHDPRTRVVLFYLESFGNPRRFARIARRVGRAKPIVAVKAGRTRAGSRAASSHTAALAGADTAVEAMLAQTGVVRAETLEEMFGIARAVVEQPPLPGRRIAVVTNAGGPAILCVDALAAAGMEVEELASETRRRLGEFLPAAASTRNPVDMIASADPAGYRRAVEVVLAADEVDGLVVIYTPTGLHGLPAIAEAIAGGVAAARAGGVTAKPVLASLVGTDEEIYRLEVPETGERVPVYTFPEEIGRVFGRLGRWAEWQRAPAGRFPVFGDQDLESARRLCRDALAELGDGWLPVATARRVLALAGLRLAPGAVAESAEQAVATAREVGFPVAMAAASRDLVHKTEHGLIALDVADEPAVAAAFERMAGNLAEAGASFQGVLVQPMIRGGSEVMIGVDHDPTFGPVVAFGLGGIHVEILRDVAFRVAPLTDVDARDMVREIRGHRLLEGYRGHPPADVPALEEALLRLSRLVDTVPEIAELDLNPVFALEPGEGYRIVDVRIRVEGASPPPAADQSVRR